MNTELFTQLNKHCNDTLESGAYGTNEYNSFNSTRDDFGTEDNICLPFGKYFYAYTDQSEGLPMPMFCLPLRKEMYEDSLVDCHQVLIWKLESTDIPFDNPFAPVPEGTIDIDCEVCPGEAEVLSGNNYH